MSPKLNSFLPALGFSIFLILGLKAQEVNKLDRATQKTDTSINKIDASARLQAAFPGASSIFYIVLKSLVLCSAFHSRHTLR